MVTFKKRKRKFDTYSSKTIILTGGLNEQVSNLEQKAGELYACSNYEEIDGEYHGYRSVPGFEVIDGTEETIINPVNLQRLVDGNGDYLVDDNGDYLVALDPTDTITVGWPSSVPLAYIGIDENGDTIWDDTAREDRRDNIVPVDTDLDSRLLGNFRYDNKSWSIIGNGDTNLHELYVEDSTLGWLQVALPSSIPFVSTDPIYNIATGRLSIYPYGNGNTDIVSLCSSKDKAVILSKTSGGAYQTEEVEGDAADGDYPFLPSDTDTEFPIRSHLFNDRLFLAFPNGYVTHSQTGLGKTTGAVQEWNPAVSTAGDWYFAGGEVSDMIIAPSTLVVFLDSQIHLIKLSNPDVVTGIDMVSEVFSELSGAIANTAKRILGTVVFCDDRGVTTLEASDVYGDFSAKSISKKVQNTYQTFKDTIVGTVVDRNKNQYIIYFSNGQGLTITFANNKKVKGAHKFNTKLGLSFVREWPKESKRFLGSSEDTFVRVQHDDAQSFNGSVIEAFFSTAFFHYGTPTTYKNFKRILLELEAGQGQIFSVGCAFDYSGSGIHKAGTFNTTPVPATGGTWGVSVWNHFTWGVGAALTQDYTYIRGTGVNMGFTVKSSTKYYDPHVIHNAIASYTMGETKF